jgi:hypothetical protein
MIGGLATSIVVFAVGAVLDFAVTVNPNQHGFTPRAAHTVVLQRLSTELS